MNRLRRFNTPSLLFNRAWITIISISVILVSLIYYIHSIKSTSLTYFDDAYMFIRYAKNFLSGYGFAWNHDGIQTYGTTSLLYLFLVIIFQWIFTTSDGSTILILVSSILGLLSIMIMANTCVRFSRSKQLANAQAPVLATLMALFAFSPTYLFHATSGMDTNLSLLLNSCLVFSTLHWVYHNNKYTLAIAILTGYLSYLARPDNLIYALLFPISCILILREDNRKTGWIYYLLGFAMILFVDSQLKLMIYGDPLPLPFYAKTSGYYEGYSLIYKWNPILNLFDFGTLILPFLIVTALLLPRISIKLLVAFMIPVIITFSYYFSVIQIMGFQARFYFPALPFFVICSFLVCDHFLQVYSGNEVQGLLQGQFIRIRFLAIFIIITTIPQPLIKETTAEVYRKLFLTTPEIYSSSTVYIISSQQPLPKIGWWQSIEAVYKIAENLPDNTTFALSENGFIGAKAPDIYIIDPLGLNDPIFAHQGFSVDEFFARKPELIWLPPLSYTKIVSSILDSKELWNDYEFYPGAFDYGLAIRKNSRNYQLIHAAVERSWRETYTSLKMDEYMARPVSK